MGTLVSRKLLPAVFSYAEMLGIDKCFGVVGSGAFAAAMLKAKMRLFWWIVLPAITWVVHTADGLWDARKCGSEIPGRRHKFYREHFRLLATLAALIAAVCSIAFLCMPDTALTGGFLL